MITPARTRRRIDRIVAAVLAVAVIALAAIVWLTSDIRATTSDPGPAEPAPSSAAALPTRLVQAWTAATDAGLGAVASPYGVVVTADQHTMTGRDAETGAVRWSYGRSNLPLCGFGSGDTDAAGAKLSGKVRGIVALYEKNGWCSQVQALDPVTGARTYARTSANQPGGSLVFGGPYAGWMGSTLMEVWRNDLVRTFQYGDQPNPTNPGTRHLGCIFTDLAISDDQLATVEHCAAQGPNARLVFNWADPNPHDKDQDQFKHTPRAEIDTGSPTALLVGMTRDRAAVLVSAPEPAIVVYDADGTESGRTKVDIPAAEITAATGVTRSLTVDGSRIGDPDTTRYSVVGSHLIAMSSVSVDVTVTVTPTTTSSSADDGTAGSTAPSTGPTTQTEQRDSVKLDWTIGGALGLPAVIDDAPLLPVRAGLAAVDKKGTITRTVPVDRAGYTGPVDAAAVGAMVIETRGGTVVAYRR